MQGITVSLLAVKIIPIAQGYALSGAIGAEPPFSKKTISYSHKTFVLTEDFPKRYEFGDFPVLNFRSVGKRI